LVVSRPSWVTGFVIVCGLATYNTIRPYDSIALALVLSLVVAVAVDICLAKLSKPKGSE
jgi:energy-converting hydrogenase Eha subunit H